MCTWTTIPRARTRSPRSTGTRAGALTAEPGSPFTAGGAGTGAGLASEGAIQLAGGGRFLLAVDAGSNQVSVQQILPGGSLRLRDVVSAGGVLPVSIAVHGSLVYVANAGPADQLHRLPAG